mmetsp:Transcript_32611/g.68015  ORF Transcript_32611/g.68015 Transcript_32611/m.68015 type:complete len:203 (+) Transcript_32611:800-1408(+)
MRMDLLELLDRGLSTRLDLTVLLLPVLPIRPMGLHALSGQVLGTLLQKLTRLLLEGRSMKPLLTSVLLGADIKTMPRDIQVLWFPVIKIWQTQPVLLSERAKKTVRKQLTRLCLLGHIISSRVPEAWSERVKTMWFWERKLPLLPAMPTRRTRNTLLLLQVPTTLPTALTVLSQQDGRTTRMAKSPLSALESPTLQMATMLL